MTANHLEHKIATFLGSPEGVTAPVVKREARRGLGQRKMAVTAIISTSHRTEHATCPLSFQ